MRIWSNWQATPSSQRGSGQSIVVPVALAMLTVVAALPFRSIAQAVEHAPVAEFASVPRFAAPGPAALAAPAAAPSAAACNPGTQTIEGNVVSLDMHLRRVDASINNPSDLAHPIDQLNLRSYSGCLTSPEIDVKPGNSLHVALHNDLSKHDPTCDSPAGAYLQLPYGVGCFNTTNLHTHGLHVSPSGQSDNVLREVDPETVAPYVIDIPDDHPSGTFWYHAHMHGSTAVGLASADAGVLIIRGNRKYDQAHPGAPADIDTVLHGPDQQPFPENLFVLQQLAYACFWTSDPTKPYDNLITTTGLYQTGSNVNANSPWACVPPTSVGKGTMTKGVVENFNSQLFSASIWDTNGRFTSINGVVEPRMTIPAGQIQRWRFVHAGVHDTINLQVVKIPPDTAKQGLLSDRLAGKSRLQQADIVKEVCKATAQTLIPQFEIADDGLTRTHIRVINPHGEEPIRVPNPSGMVTAPIYPSNYLQPGYRSDVLVVFPEEGDYCLLDQAAASSERINPSTPVPGQGPTIPQLLAHVHVTGGKAVQGDLEEYVLKTLFAGNETLPAKVRQGLLKADLTPWAPFTELAAPSPHPEPYAHFQINDNPPGPGTKGLFVVNGQSYDPNVVTPLLTRKVETTDDWSVEIEPQLTGTPPAIDGGEPHIFHIHVNPFEVVDIKRLYFDDPHSAQPTRKVSIYDSNGKCIPGIVAGDAQHLADQYCGLYHVFRDTLFIENSYEATLRTHYARYTGEFVLHCHILDHEDAGMMANVVIADDPAHPPPREKVLMPTMDHHRATQQ
jgi:FtsP/CotA-like multicopper oxidase with cupredoxin domain